MDISMERFQAPFIKVARPFDPADHAPAPAPLFRRRFTLEKTGEAVLRFCGLGYGYCYINGKPVSEDILCSAVSEYDKLVWYREYDVSGLLRSGENVAAVILGNGYFNENFPSAWDHNKAVWRDHPKFALSLFVDGECVLESDEQFVCTEKSFVPYNQLRSGEVFDARLYDPGWKEVEFDDSAYEKAVVDHGMDSAVRMRNPCAAIREFEEYDFISVKEAKGGYLLDFGVNISGYVRMRADEKEGTEIVLRHAEDFNEDGTLKLNGLDMYYTSVDFQTDRYICGKRPFFWSPKFTYHGFRYVFVEGITKKPEKGDFRAVFIHQAIDRAADFECSNELINKIYDGGIRSSYSNMHDILTDDPTREKLGWLNDAQASCEQIYINFDIKAFMDKWGEDILISMQEDGQIPDIVPSPGWGFGAGPVSDGFLFAMPWTEYLYMGDSRKLVRFLPYLKRYYDFYAHEDVNMGGWLTDWDEPRQWGDLPCLFQDKRFVFLFYWIKFCRVIILAEKLFGRNSSVRYEQDMEKAAGLLKKEYLDEKGRSVLDNQTAIAMLLSLKLFDNDVLIDQMKRRVEEDDFHITSGVMGLQYVYDALAENGAAEYAYRLITAEGKPSFSFWFENGATNLWEIWSQGISCSRNHHMFSGVLSFFFKALLGIAPQLGHPGFARVELKPNFIRELSFCRGYVDTPRGRISASWERKGDGVEYRVSVPEGMEAYYDGALLKPGENTFFAD